MELFQLIFDHPAYALTIVFAAIAYFLARELLKKFKDEVGELKQSARDVGAQMRAHQNIVSAEFKKYRDMIEDHKDGLGKATKAINGDMLAIKEKIFQLKQDMTAELNQVSQLSQTTGKSLELARETSKLAVDAINEKLGRVILIEKSVETFGNQISKLQESAGKTHIDLSKHAQWFGSIAAALKEHKEQLQKYANDAKKGG